ncbi:hypothetical protein XFF6992_400034 [Xanthomonas citri pv. fuscans]|nr:hypothetical protein XFF6992_400034 [Xanthomonas citri pv. fuscans]SOO35846.1 hypothetical protein XFF6994_5790010 [Xanthomonas citri pv. fuscans]
MHWRHRTHSAQAMACGGITTNFPELPRPPSRGVLSHDGVRWQRAAVIGPEATAAMPGRVQVAEMGAAGNVALAHRLRLIGATWGRSPPNPKIVGYPQGVNTKCAQIAPSLAAQRAALTSGRLARREDESDCAGQVGRVLIRSPHSPAVDTRRAIGRVFFAGRPRARQPISDRASSPVIAQISVGPMW